ncbi:MAG TPA: FtsX-like permease family protein [Planctomycetota bacterium]|nr:FtsX-like permease family protein [Planctomycetota bacterium]
MRSLPIDYALKNLGRRRLRTVLTGLANALAAAALLGTTTFVTSLTKSFQGAGREDVAIVLSRVSDRDVLRSTVTAATGDLLVADVPGIVRVGGASAASSEIHMGTNLRIGEAPAEGTRDEVVYSTYVRGITDAAFLVHDGVTIVEGRVPRTGEVLVGALAAQKAEAPVEAFQVGKKLRFENGTFTICGVFRAPGTTMEGEIWAPLWELRGLSRRDDSSAIFIKMEDDDGLADVELFAKRRLDLELSAIPSNLYYKELAQYFDPILKLTWVMSFLIALAVLATLANTLSTAVEDRKSELATLYAMGFTGGALARSLLTEALLLASAGGLVGLLVARFVLSESAFRIGMAAFSLEVTPLAVLVGFAGVLLIAVLGTIPATAKVLRMPVTEALKDS